MEEQYQHAKYSPSKLPRIVLCPASALYESSEDNATSSSSSYADEGTMLHLATSESLDLNELTLSTETINKFSLDKSQQEAVQECLDYVFALRTKYRDITDYEEYIERKVSLKGFITSTNCEDLREVEGTLDFALIANRVLHITDWKFGAGIEVFPDSEQLKAYALGALSNPLNAKFYDAIHLTVVQPRIHSEELVKTVTITPQELLDWLHVSLIPALLKIRAKHSVYSPSEKACRWCPAKHTCLARREYNLEVAANVFAVHDALPTPPMNELLQLLDKADTLRAYLKDLEQYAFNQLTRGVPIDKYKIVAGRSSRAWKDPDKAKQWCLEQGLDELAISEVKFLGPAKIEKLLTKQARVSEEFTSLVIKPEGKPTLVPASDPRTAIEFRTAEQIFSDALMEEEI